MDFGYAYKISDAAHRGQQNLDRNPKFKKVLISGLTTCFFIWMFFWFKSNFERLNQELEEDKR